MFWCAVFNWVKRSLLLLSFILFIMLFSIQPVLAGLFHSQLRQQGRKEQGVGANFSTYTLYIDEICRYMLLVIQRNFNSSS